MDTSDPRIAFDRDGRCNHCTEFLNKKAKHIYRGKQSDEALERMFETVRAAGRGRAYDCVIGVSGGTDSSYLVRVAKENGLRPLTVHMDNGWNSEKAVLNIKRVTDALGVDYESFV